MKWFKHDANANSDSKLQNVLLDYGLEGYGLYWYCIELIAGNVEADNITFSLEHDARIIARNTGSTAQKVEEMMRYFVTIGLFENADGVITCMKLAKRLDQSMTSNPGMRAIINEIKQGNGRVIAKPHDEKNGNHDPVMTSHDSVMQDQIRSEEIREEEIKDSLSSKHDDSVKKVIGWLNSATGSKYKASTRSHAKNINGRLSDGHSVEDLKLVIDFKAEHWGADQKMAEYLRPQTLFGPEKFTGYLARAKSWITSGRPRFINGEWEGFEGKRKPMSNIAAAQRQARALIESGAVSYDDNTPL